MPAVTKSKCANGDGNGSQSAIPSTMNPMSDPTSDPMSGQPVPPPPQSPTPPEPIIKPSEPITEFHIGDEFGTAKRNLPPAGIVLICLDRKSTRLNSSH